MVRRSRTGTLAIAALILLGAVRLTSAGEGVPTISDVDVAPVWGSVYKLSALIRTERGLISAAEYRVGTETGTLFASDGLLDSREELVETYVDVPAGQGIAIRARTAGGWSDWQEVDGPGAGDGAMDGCALTARVAGQAGWYRGDVTVDCGPLLRSASADRVQYSLNFGDWMEAESGFIIAEEGVHWVQVRPVSIDGVAGLPSTFTVAIDKTAPRLQMQHPPAPRMNHADMLYLDFAAEDELSGVATVFADLNAEQEILAGMPVELWQLPLGLHTLSVYARDRAGNTAVSDELVELEISVDTAGLARLVQLFSAKGRLDGYTGTKGKLMAHLSQTNAALGEGDMLAARSHLTDFVDAVQQGMAAGLIFGAEGNVLLLDGIWLMDHLEEDRSADPPEWAGD